MNRLEFNDPAYAAYLMPRPKFTKMSKFASLSKTIRNADAERSSQDQNKLAWRRTPKMVSTWDAVLLNYPNLPSLAKASGVKPPAINQRHHSIASGSPMFFPNGRMNSRNWFSRSGLVSKFVFKYCAADRLSRLDRLEQFWNVSIFDVEGFIRTEILGTTSV